jgi:hypothetical protein
MSVIRATPSRLADVHRTAAAHEDATLALGQREEGVSGSATRIWVVDGDLQPPPMTAPLKGRDEGNAPALDAREHGMPFPRAPDAVHHRFLGMLGKIQPGAEMLAHRRDDADLGLLLRPVDGLPQRRHHGVADGIALLRPVEAKQRDVVVDFVAQQGHVGSVLPIASASCPTLFSF